MTWRLEKATVGVPNLTAVIVAVALGATWAASLANDQENTNKRVDRVEVLIPTVAELRTGQAVLGERMKTLEEAVKELKEDQKDGFKRILDKLDSNR